MPNLDADKAKLKKYTQTLGGKTYLTVAGRVFAAHDARQLVGIETVLEETDTHYRYVAIVKVLNTHLPGFESLPPESQIGVFTGTSQSVKKGGRSAEGTNPLEVAETSAVGRALGFAGFGDLESIASYEEVAVAVSRGEAQADFAPSVEQKKALLEAAKKSGLAKNPDELGVKAKEVFDKALDDLTAGEVVAWTQELKAANGGKGDPPF